MIRMCQLSVATLLHALRRVPFAETSRFKLAAAGVAIGLFPTPAVSGDLNLSRVLSREPNASFSTAKKAIDLEFCVADVVSDDRIVTVLRNGKSITYVVGYIGQYPVTIVAIKEEPTETTLTVYAHHSTRSYADGLVTCL